VMGCFLSSAIRAPSLRSMITLFPGGNEDETNSR